MNTKSMKRLLATVQAWVVLMGTLMPYGARADADTFETLTIEELAPSASASATESARRAALQVRDLPVTPSGAYNRGYTFDVPPGRAGHRPTLALSYSSSAFRSETAFGTGWSLGLPAIERSTSDGVPKTQDGEYLDDDRAFASPSGRLVRIDCEFLPLDCPAAAATDSTIWMPENDVSLTRYEQKTTTDEWVEYLADGRRRIYGGGAPAANTRIVNPRGTFAWLLVKEVDRFGNEIDYTWFTNASRTSLEVPQIEPVPLSVAWGANPTVGLSHVFTVEFSYQTAAGSVDFLRGGVRRDHVIDEIRVVEGGAIRWRYEFGLASSPFSGRLLLNWIERRGEGEPTSSFTRDTFTYSGRSPSWNSAPVSLPEGVYSEGCEAGGYCKRGQWEPGSLTRSSLVKNVRSAYQFVDWDADGDVDILYHPAHTKLPFASVVPEKSFEQKSGAYVALTESDLLAFQWSRPGTGPVMFDGFQDLDGDLLLDGYFLNIYSVRHAGNPTLQAEGSDCRNAATWNNCGDIDPLPPAFRTPAYNIVSRAATIGPEPAPGAADVVNCLAFATRCAYGEDIGAVEPPLVTGLPPAVTLPDGLAHGELRVVGGDGSRYGSVAYGWPFDARVDIAFSERPDGTTNISTRSDIYAPFVDVDADGDKDLLLLKILYPKVSGSQTSAGLTGSSVRVRAFEAVAEPPPTLVKNDEISDSIYYALHNSNGTQQGWDTVYNPNILFLDWNSDGLPDLLVAKKQDQSNLACASGHDVYLNRGGTEWKTAAQSALGFTETWTSNSTTHALDRVVNHAGGCFGTDSSRGAGRVTMQGSTFVDINSDGREDVLMLYLDESAQTQTRRLYLNGNRGLGADLLPSTTTWQTALNSLPNWGALPPALSVYSGDPSKPNKLRLGDMLRFVDMDMDGLVDVVQPGQVGGFGAKWYRNTGEVPDLLISATSDAGAIVNIQYAPAATLGLPGQFVVSSLEISDVGSGGSSSEDIALSYPDRFVRSAVTRDPVGFPRIESLHVGGPGTGSLHVIREYEHIPARLDGVDYPLATEFRRVVAETVAGSATYTQTTESTYDTYKLSDLCGNQSDCPRGVRARLRKTTETECLGNQCESSQAEVLARDARGFPTSEAEGDPTDATTTVTTTTAFQHLTNPWVQGLATLTKQFGYDEPGGVPALSEKLSELEVIYDLRGVATTEQRSGKNASHCADDEKDETLTTTDAVGNPTQIVRGSRTETLGYGVDRLYVEQRTLSGVGVPTLVSTYEYQRSTGAITQTTDPNSNAITTVRDSRGRPTRVSNQTTAEVLSETAYVDKFTALDGGPRVDETVYRSATRALSRRTWLSAAGAAVGSVEGDAVDGFIRRVRRVQDGFGNTIAEYKPQFAANMSSYVSPFDGPTTATASSFDGYSRLVERIHPGGRVEAFEYAPREVSTIDARGLVTVRTYDHRGDLSSIERYGSGSVVQARTDYIRNGRGQIVRLLDADDHARRLSYDGRGRLASVTLPRADNSYRNYCFDDDDRLIRMDTKAGRTQTIARDGYGRAEELVVTGGAAPSRTTTYSYDTGLKGLGKLAARIDDSGSYSYGYDAFGRLKTKAFVASSAVMSGLQITQSASFDRQGVPTAIAIGGSIPARTISFTNDIFGRPGKAQSSGSLDVSSIDFDAFDRPVYAEHGATSSTWEYDPDFEVLTAFEVSTIGGSAAMASGAAFGSEAALSGEVAEGEGEAAVAAEPLDVEFVPGFFGLDEEGNPLIEPTSEPSADGLVPAEVLGAAPMAMAMAATGPLLRLEYTHDDNLNVLSETRLYHLPNSKLHEYDEQDRLTQTIQTFGSNNPRVEQYKYSDAGYLAVAAGQTYVQAPTGPPVVASVREGPTTVRTLGYDDDGVVVSDTPLAGAIALKVDGGFCLTEAVRTTSRLDRICAPDGDELFRKTTKNGVVGRVITPFDLVEVRPEENEWVLRLGVQGMTLAEEHIKLSSGTTNEVRMLHADMRGSVLASGVQGDTALTQDIEYDAWGQSNAGVAPPTHRFVDEEPDLFGYATFGKRVYSPGLRRWLAPDPRLSATPAVDEADARQLDLWGYAANNPVVRRDVSGEIAPAVGAAILFAIAIGFESDTDPVKMEDGSTYGGADISKPLRAASVPVNAAFVAVGAVAAGDDPIEALVGEYDPLTNGMNPGGVSGVPGKDFKPKDGIDEPFKRGSNLNTTQPQRDSVQGKPCVDCGKTAPKMVADHKDPVSVEYYRTGTNDVKKQQSVEAVQPHCPSCSSQQGGKLSAFAREMKRQLGLDKKK